MAYRSRIIKHEFFLNEILAELPPETRLLYIGLWTIADREGRLEDRPKKIKAELFPYEDYDVDSMLADLAQGDDPFLIRYSMNGTDCIFLPKFTKHQSIHRNEKTSNLPEFPEITGNFPKLQEITGQKNAVSDKANDSNQLQEYPEITGNFPKVPGISPTSTSTSTNTSTTKRTGINNTIPPGAGAHTRARSKEVAILEKEESNGGGGGGFSASLEEEEKEPSSISQDVRILQAAILKKWRGQITTEPGQSACRNALEEHSLDKLLEALDRSPAALKSPTPTAALNCVVKYAENGSWGRTDAPEPEKDDRPADIRQAEDRLKYLNDVVAGEEEIYGIIRWLSRKLKLNEEQTFLRYEFLKYSLTYYQEVWVDPGE